MGEAEKRGTVLWTLRNPEESGGKGGLCEKEESSVKGGSDPMILYNNKQSKVLHHKVTISFFLLVTITEGGVERHCSEVIETLCWKLWGRNHKTLHSLLFPSKNTRSRALVWLWGNLLVEQKTVNTRRSLCDPVRLLFAKVFFMGPMFALHFKEGSVYSRTFHPVVNFNDILVAVVSARFSHEWRWWRQKWWHFFIFLNIFFLLTVCNVSATLKWPKVGQHAISTLFLSLHHSLPLPLSFPSFTRQFKDTGFSFCRTRNINICRTHHQHPSSTHHPLSCHVSLTLLEQDKGVLHAMLHSSDGCTTAMSTTEERQGHTGGHDQYIQKNFLHFHNSFFFPPQLPPLKTPRPACVGFIRRILSS